MIKESKMQVIMIIYMVTIISINGTGYLSTINGAIGIINYIIFSYGFYRRELLDKRSLDKYNKMLYTTLILGCSISIIICNNIANRIVLGIIIIYIFILVKKLYSC